MTAKQTSAKAAQKENDMKKMIQATLLMASALAMMTACSKEPKKNLTGNSPEVLSGPSDGGGGNTTSDVEKINATINIMPKYLIYISNHLELFFDQLQDSEFSRGYLQFKEPFDRILKGSSSMKVGLKEALTKNMIKIYATTDKCPAPFENSDAAALNNEICFNVTRLAKLGLAGMENELIALAFHEVSHIYGFNEDSAKRIQNFVVKHPKLFYTYNYAANRRLINSVYLLPSSRLIDDGTGKLRSQSDICYDIGITKGSIEDTFVHASEYGKFEIELPDGAKDLLFNTSVEVEKISGFCMNPNDGRPSYEDSVEYGNIQQLTDRLQKTAGLFEKTGKTIISILQEPQWSEGDRQTEKN